MTKWPMTIAVSLHLALPFVQVLKMAQWDGFFTETYQLCQKHCPDSPEYFGTLASLLMQRLVKSITKAITPESASFLRGFTERLAKDHALTRSPAYSAVEHEETLVNVAANLLNFGSAPGLNLIVVPFEISD